MEEKRDGIRRSAPVGVMAVEDDEAIRIDFEAGVRAHPALSWLGGACLDAAPLR